MKKTIGLELVGVGTTMMLVAQVFCVGLVRAQVPIPPELRSARTIFFEQTSGELPALDELAKQFQSWNRFEVVDNRDAAEVVATIAVVATGDAVTVPIGGIFVGAQQEAIVFAVRSAKTDRPLWSDREAIGSFSRYGGIKKLVQRLRQRVERK